MEESKYLRRLGWCTQMADSDGRDGSEKPVELVECVGPTLAIQNSWEKSASVGTLSDSDMGW